MKTDDRFSSRRGRRDLLLVLIVAVFFLGLLPPAASFVFYSAFPDQHYTDAAIPMFRNNDFLTPRQADKPGSARLAKPPLTYWLIVGGYEIFGVGPLSSRLIFLLSGCATIWLAYELAFKLTDDRRSARVAALILLSHPLITSMSIRTLPDILLSFWILVSGYGFIRLICLNDVRSSSYWAAYGGAALAIETKGLLGFLLIAYAVAFAFATSSEAHPFRRIFNFKIMLVALLIACSGFILMFWKHGQVFLQSFWADQVGQKVDSAPGHFVLRATGFALVFFLTFLPWLLCRGYFFLKGKVGSPLTIAQRRSYLFIGYWALLLSISFSWGKLLSAGMIMRYMLPAVPLLGVVIAIELCRFSESDLAVVLNPLRRIAVLCFFAVALFGLLLFQETGFTNYLALLAVVSLMVLFVILQRWKNLSLPACFSLSCFLFWPLVFSIACPFKLPDESVTIARELKTVAPPNQTLVVIGETALESRINMVAGGDYLIYQFRTLSEYVFARPGQSLLIVSQSDAELLPPNSFQLRRIGSGLGALAWDKFITATLKGDAKRYLDSRIELYYAATPFPKKE